MDAPAACYLPVFALLSVFRSFRTSYITRLRFSMAESAYLWSYSIELYAWTFSMGTMPRWPHLPCEPRRIISITEFFHILTLGTTLIGAFLTDLRHLTAFSRPRRTAVTVFSHTGGICPLGEMKLIGDSVKLRWLTGRM